MKDQDFGAYLLSCKPSRWMQLQFAVIGIIWLVMLPSQGLIYFIIGVLLPIPDAYRFNIAVGMGVAALIVLLPVTGSFLLHCITAASPKDVYENGVRIRWLPKRTFLFWSDIRRVYTPSFGSQSFDGIDLDIRNDHALRQFRIVQWSNRGRLGQKRGMLNIGYGHKPCTKAIETVFELYHASQNT